MEWSKCLCVSLGLLLGLVQIPLHQSLWNERSAWSEIATNEILWVPKMYQIFSMGHLASMLDVLFLQCLVDNTSKKVEKGKHFPLYYRFKVLVELDPLLFEAAWMGGHLLAVVQDDGWGAQELLEKSLNFVMTELPSYSNTFQENYWPDPWKIPLLLAYTELFHLDNLPHAARAFQKAAAMPGSPLYLQRLVARFNRPGGQYEVGLRLLNFMLEGAKEERVREALEKKRKNLKILAYLDQLKRSSFSNSFRVPKRDPWGGRLFLNSKKQWDTETPYEVVFSLQPGES